MGRGDRYLALVIATLVVMMGFTARSGAWSNGGYSSNPSNPDYGTHDWIGEHALDWLPTSEKKFITDNLAIYLYGTELPDNDIASDGIGDRYLHHVYFYQNGEIQDAAAAIRASEEYEAAKTHLQSSNYALAAKVTGIMAGYITDLAVFGHVMGSGTDWGSESHHSDYEEYVSSTMTSYTSVAFDSYLEFDGNLEYIAAYDGALALAFNTTFGQGSLKNCLWMDRNYDWSNTAFKNSAGASLNNAVNVLADVLHTLVLDSGYTPLGDLTNPLVAITSPTDNEKLNTTTITVLGTASDDVAVEKVEISADGSSWTLCAGTASWSGLLVLGHGSNTIYAMATDTSGNVGSTSIRVIITSSGSGNNNTGNNNTGNNGHGNNDTGENLTEGGGAFNWVFIGAILAIAVLAVAAFWLWRKESREKKDVKVSEDEP